MLVRVVSDNISFGCMKGSDYSNNTPVSIILYDNISEAHTNFVPIKNDLIWCTYFHSHVFRPIARINESHLCIRNGLNLPKDILWFYFPLVET